MGCRSLARCNAAKDASLSSGSGGGSLEVMELDLASFASVRRYVVNVCVPLSLNHYESYVQPNVAVRR